MAKPEQADGNKNLGPAQQTLGQLWEDHVRYEFSTRSIRMDWMLPGVPPTGKPVEVPLVAIVRLRGGKLAHEHIYWDQASVLVQIGLIDAAKLPVAGVESTRKVLDPTLPANELMKCAESSK